MKRSGVALFHLMVTSTERPDHAIKRHWIYLVGFSHDSLLYQQSRNDGAPYTKIRQVIAEINREKAVENNFERIDCFNISRGGHLANIILHN